VADDSSNNTRLQQLEQELREAQRVLAVEERKQAIQLKTNTSLREYQSLLAQQAELTDLVSEGATEYRDLLDDLTAKVVTLGSELETTNKLEKDLFDRNQDLLRQARENIKLKQEERAALSAFNQTVSQAIDFTAAFLGVQGKLFANSTQFTKSVLQQGHAFDELRANLAVTTGYANRFGSQMLELANNDRLQLSMAESNQVIGSLSNTFLEFNALGDDAQRITENLAGEFLRLGVAPEQTSQALHLLTRGFGLATENALATMDAMKRLADESGQSLAKVMGSLTKLGPQLARYGQSTEIIFNKLIKTARQFGMDAESAFGLSEMFDTYESAFNVAGRLNAQFRTQINAMELMGTLDPAERLRILREELTAVGLSYENISIRERQALAAITGRGVDEVMALLKDPIEAYKLQKDEQDRAENLARFTSAQKKMAESFEKMYIALEPVTTLVMDMITGVTNVLNPILNTMTGKVALLALFAKGAVQPFILMGRAASKLAAVTGQVSKLGAAMAKLSSFARIAAGFMAAIVGYQQGGITGAAKGIGSLASGFLGSAAIMKALKMAGRAPGGFWGKAAAGTLGFLMGSGLFDFATQGWMNDGVAGPGIYMPHGDWSKAVRVPAGDQITRDSESGMTVFDYGGLARKERDKRLAQQSLKQKIDLNLPEIVLYLSPDGKKEIGRLGAQTVKGLIAPDRIVRA